MEEKKTEKTEEEQAYERFQIATRNLAIAERALVSAQEEYRTATVGLHKFALAGETK
jgi:hypothetical protein